MQVYSYPEVQATGLGKIDSRVKILLVFSAFIVLFLAQRKEVYLAYGLGSVLCVALSGVSLKHWFLRMVPLFILAIFAGLTQLFFTEGSPWFTIHLGPFHWIGTYEGLEHGVLLGLRMLSAVSIMFVLTLTTPIHDWIQALSWFHLPQTIIELMTMAYSSLFVLLEELDRLLKAQRMRLGANTWWKAVRSLGTVGGILVVRIFDRSSRLEMAMRCRGYCGRMVVERTLPWRRQDSVLLLLGLVGIWGSLLFSLL